MEIPDLNFLTPMKNSANDIPSQIFFTVQEMKSEKQSSQSLTSFQDNFDPILCADVLKKTLNQTWQMRHFILSKTRLFYYDDAEKQQLKGCFNLVSLSTHMSYLEFLDEEHIINLCVKIQDPSRDYVKVRKQLLSMNFQQITETFKQWKIQFKNVIQNIRNNNMLLVNHYQIVLDSFLNMQPKYKNANFWNKLIISKSQLCQYANHLDIVFFKSKKPIASVHRLLMRSSFDHVGILLRDNSDRLLILQAIQSRGVWINQWNQMLPHFREHYEEIAYRKLIVKGESDLDYMKLQKYLQSIIGNKYELSLSKLLIGDESTNQDQDMSPTRKSNKIIPEGIRKQIAHKKQKTFFCSELVADIYIKLRLITGKKKNEFWPRDFENCLPLEKGASLSPLMHVSL